MKKFIFLSLIAMAALQSWACGGWVRPNYYMFSVFNRDLMDNNFAAKTRQYWVDYTKDQSANWDSECLENVDLNDLQNSDNIIVETALNRKDNETLNYLKALIQYLQNDGSDDNQWNYPTKEELAQKQAEFEEMVTGILNEVLRDDYSDVEKILALYIYFSNNYTYDYDTYYKMSDEPVQGICAYRFFTTKHGICAECSVAFSFLLLQAGVDAAVCGGNRESDGEGHAWTYVTINGKNYHVDPTFVMESGNCLSYFMMTDSQRYLEGDFKKEMNTVGCHYKSDRNGSEYNADDDFFAPLWGKYLTSFDHEKKIIYYKDIDGNTGEFDYSAFG